MTCCPPIRLASYDREQIAAAIRTAVDELGGWDALIKPGGSVLLKPNFVVPEAADKWATTHPAVYMAVADLLLATGRRVTIGESPAFGSAQAAVAAHEVLAECRDRQIDICTFAAARPMTGLNAGTRFRELTVTDDLRTFDAIINLPKLKVHQQMVFTGAVKNLYGCVPGKRKAWRHFICDNDPVLFGRMLLATAAEVAPVLHIGDGIVAMHRRGPRGGAPYPLNALLISRCPLAHDWLECSLMGIPHMTTPLFQAAGAERCAQLAVELQPLLAGWTPAPDLELSFAAPIRFSPYQMLRSVYRSARQKFAESRSVS